MKRLTCVVVFFILYCLNGDVGGRRIRHFKRRSEKLGFNSLLSEYTSTRFLKKDKSCLKAKLPERCNCTKVDGSLDIQCQEASLGSIPILHFGPNTVEKLNLEHNRIATINIGAFFGTKIRQLLLGYNEISRLEFLAFWGLEFHLEVLDLSYNSFVQVPSSSLRLLRNLRNMSLEGNAISSLRDFDFGYLRKLEVLILDRNPISTIAQDAFTGTKLSLLSLNTITLRDGLNSFPSCKLTLLKGLSLANNSLQEYPQDWFNDLKCLRYLSLNNNSISELNATSFKGISDTLLTLELVSNDFEYVPEKVIRVLSSLTTLDLSDNYILKVNADNFNESTNLQNLNLTYNYISRISTRGLHGLDSIQKIDLRFNHLITLDDRTFYWENSKGREILVANNPYLCNCLLKWFKREFRRKSKIWEMFVDGRSMTCRRPYFLEGVPVTRVPKRDLTCNHDYYYYFPEDDPDEQYIDVYDEDDDDEDDQNYDDHGNHFEQDYDNYDLDDDYGDW